MTPKQKALKEALNFVDPASLEYTEWTKVGTALKNEGLDMETWNQWSQQDQARYKGIKDISNHWNSFKNGAVNAGTVFYHAKQNGYIIPKELKTQQANKYNTTFYVNDQSKAPHQETNKTSMTAKQIEQSKKNLEQWENNLDSTEEVKSYLNKRGITLATAHKYHLGAGSNGLDYTLVIPNSNGSYTERYLTEQPNGQRYRKNGNGLFNAGAIQDGDTRTPIFVTEGQIDALSILQEGYKAIALNSTTNTSLLINAINQLEEQAPLILCMDNDKSGYSALKKLKAGIVDTSLAVFEIPPKYNDINEFYLNDKDAFKKKLNNAYEANRVISITEKIERYNTIETNLSTLEDLFSEEKNFVDPISTGFKNLDEILEGGLYGELYTLGAGSGEGKTAFSLQMMDNIAQAGHDVIIISLEMSKTELVARSLSRLTYDISTSVKSAFNEAYAKTEVGISNLRRYEHYSKAEKDVINQAKERYRQYAKHIHVIEGVGNINIDTIANVINQHIEFTGNVPVVLIDYLQLIAPTDIRLSDKQNIDKTMLELKRLTRDYSVPIILISSINRESYKNKDVSLSMASFKESGSIEFTSSIVITLEAEQENKTTKTREIKLSVLKNRKGRRGSFNYTYHYRYGKFEEIGNYTNLENKKVY